MVPLRKRTEFTSGDSEEFDNSDNLWVLDTVVEVLYLGRPDDRSGRL